MRHMRKQETQKLLWAQYCEVAFLYGTNDGEMLANTDLIPPIAPIEANEVPLINFLLLDLTIRLLI